MSEWQLVITILAGVGGMLALTSSPINRRIDAVDKRIDDLNRRMDGFDRRMDRIEHKIERIEDLMLKLLGEPSHKGGK